MIEGKKKRWHITKDDILSLDTVTYTKVAVAKLKPLPSICEPNSSIANGFVEIFDNDGKQLVEIPMAEIDSEASIDKFAVDASNTVYLVIAKTEKVEVEETVNESGQDKKVKKIVDKPLNLTLEDIKKRFQYFDVIYKLKDSVKIVEGEFLLTVYDNLKDFYIYKSLPVDENKMMTLMKTLISNSDTASMGLLEFYTEPLLSE